MGDPRIFAKARGKEQRTGMITVRSNGYLAIINPANITAMVANQQGEDGKTKVEIYLGTEEEDYIPVGEYEDFDEAARILTEAGRAIEQGMSYTIHDPCTDGEED